MQPRPSSTTKCSCLYQFCDMLALWLANYSDDLIKPRHQKTHIQASAALPHAQTSDMKSILFAQRSLMNASLYIWHAWLATSCMPPRNHSMQFGQIGLHKVQLSTSCAVLSVTFAAASSPSHPKPQINLDKASCATTDPYSSIFSSARRLPALPLPASLWQLG